jgi:hypothetical protein
MMMRDSLALGYAIGAVWTFFLASVFVLYKVWNYERRLRMADERIRKMLREKGVL